ncbi:MAG: hypothetical protein GF383_02250 [Candidatus Lokiarchaeota archaeon]|nr:hypothetical protein [Candidatus Lokiarchaeota archaeon]MBD3338236.1 hypothetical protein [Candidatus Lokiarchaeota archaeon]
MAELLNIKWSDVTSLTYDIDSYLSEFEKRKPELIENFKNYDPKQKIIDRIGEFLSTSDSTYKVLAIGAEWCKDCAKQVPQMVKIFKNIPNDNIEFRILYGVKVDPFRKERKKRIFWSQHHSPLEAINPNFDLIAIPTFYVFKDELYQGRIIEEPSDYDTLEEELLSLLK